MKKHFCSALILILVFAYKPNAQPISNALNFDGINDYVEIKNAKNIPQGYPNQILQPGMPDITVECWVNFTDTVFQTIMDYGFPNPYSHFSIALVDGKAAFNSTGLDAKNFFMDSTLINDGNWHHIAVTAEGAHPNPKRRVFIKLYVDFKEKLFVNFYAKYLVPRDSLLRLGKSIIDANPRYFKGSIAEFKIWNKVRPPVNEYCPTASNDSNLVMYYRFQQGIASGNNAGKTTLIDSSYSGNNATLYNFALNGNTSNWVGGSPVPPPITLKASTVVICCNSKSLDITASSANNFYSSYTWSTGDTGTSISVTPKDNATYTVTGTNSACKDTASISLSSSVGLDQNYSAPDTGTFWQADSIFPCGQSFTAGMSGVLTAISFPEYVFLRDTSFYHHSNRVLHGTVNILQGSGMRGDTLGTYHNTFIGCYYGRFNPDSLPAGFGDKNLFHFTRTPLIVSKDSQYTIQLSVRPDSTSTLPPKLYWRTSPQATYSGGSFYDSSGAVVAGTDAYFKTFVNPCPPPYTHLVLDQPSKLPLPGTVNADTISVVGLTGQSFKAGITGKLTEVDLPVFFSCQCSSKVKINILKGNGLSGAKMGGIDTSIYWPLYDWLDVNFSSQNIYVFKDSMYTIQISYQPDSSVNPLCYEWFLVNSSSSCPPYPDGTYYSASNITCASVNFRTMVIPAIPLSLAFPNCGSVMDSLSQVFGVVPYETPVPINCIYEYEVIDTSIYKNADPGRYLAQIVGKATTSFAEIFTIVKIPDSLKYNKTFSISVKYNRMNPSAWTRFGNPFFLQTPPK